MGSNFLFHMSLLDYVHFFLKTVSKNQSKWSMFLTYTIILHALQLIMVTKMELTFEDGLTEIN